MPYADPVQQRAYQNAWAQRRRREWIAEHGPCVDCGTWDALQVDHHDSATKVTHRVWTWAEARRLAELAKCVVRCISCHMAKTAANGEQSHPGEYNGAAKLTEADVLAIRASPLGARPLGRQYGVDPHNIRLIRQRRIWRHI
jgi:hypothetical protein